MPKPRQFHYRPLYYDERKERLEKIKAGAEAATATRTIVGEDGAVVQNCGLEKGFIKVARGKKHTLTFEKTSVVRLLIALAILGIFYLLMPEFFTSLWRK